MRVMITLTRSRDGGSRIILIAFLAILAVSALVAGCRQASSGRGPGERDKPPCTAELFTVKVENWPRIITLSAFTEPFFRASPGGRVSARVVSVSVREGDRVATDKVLARLDTRDLQARRSRPKPVWIRPLQPLRLPKPISNVCEDLHKLGIVPLAKLESVRWPLPRQTLPGRRPPPCLMKWK